jgi:hypothetical protein
MTNYLDHIKEVSDRDVIGLFKAEESYGDSWKKRGGVGAFMMLARKWDRLENRVREGIHQGVAPNRTDADAWDIFSHIEADKRAEGIIDDIRDLRRYLLLVEAEMLARSAASATSIHRDNQPPTT